MTALQLNADIYRNLGVIAEDETMMTKVSKYVRKLAKQFTDDSTCMTKEEYFAMLDESERQIADGKGISFTNKEDMNAWLNAL